MSKNTFDILVIGAGPGGYVAAIRAARRGANVALIEKEYLGGTCLNWGCIPTKTLIASAKILHQARHAADFGVKIGGKVTPDWPVMLQRKAEVVGKLREGIAGLLKNSGVTVFNGTGAFINRKTVAGIDAKGKVTEIKAEKIIIATGSAPARPGFIPEHKRILTSTELLEIKQIPKSLLVLGGGVIGSEFACLFAELGTKVTVLEMMPQILPVVDKEISRLLTREMKARDITILTGAPLDGIKADSKSVRGMAGKEKVSAEFMLVSIGRVPVTNGLQPELAGITVDDRGFIPVDEKCRTNMPNIFAIGDVTGRVQLAHLASAMGLCAAENAGGGKDTFSDKLVPNCIFTAPEIGTLGLSLEECKAQGLEVNVGKFPFAALGKAMAINENSGMCKIIADAKTDQVLGIHIIGPHATDLIAEAVPAMHLEITAAELGKAIHAHPTLGEAMMEAAHAVHGESVHMAAPRRRN